LPIIQHALNVVRVFLQRLFAEHGAPEFIRSDNGPEFIAKIVKRWLAPAGAQTMYIEPGSPWQNAYVESFHGKFRDECLAEYATVFPTVCGDFAFYQFPTEKMWQARFLSATLE